jgi:hypothetical protein
LPAPAELKMAILNHPVSPHAVAWSAAALVKVKEFGFNAIQVNIGWGPRPADEPLNLEDVVELATDVWTEVGSPLSPNSDPARLEHRRAELRERVRLSRAAGLRTAFNFGAPYNKHGLFGGEPPNCILDENVLRRHELLLRAFGEEFEVDDLWLYTYDQDAWLCSEFEGCPRCHGRPLHERVTLFLGRLVAAWRRARPEGRVWWEPWELSAGQIHRVLATVTTEGLGLALHNNAAEVMVALPADRHVRNLARAAAARGIPVTIEGFLGAASEEVEPFTHLQSPVTTYRQVVAMQAVPGVTGIKEYFGLDIGKEDPNLRAAALAFANTALSDDELLGRLSEGYGSPEVRKQVQEVWRIASQAMETYPWDASWYVREVGKSVPAHSLNAAAIRAFCADTPAWRSTRAASFMLIDDLEPHPWLLEDLQLRWSECARLQADALAIGREVSPRVAVSVQAEFQAFLYELAEFRRRCLAYAFHCRETNLAMILRTDIALGRELSERLIEELHGLLLADRDNAGTCDYDDAIELLEADPHAFLGKYFLPVPVSLGVREYQSEDFLRKGFPQPMGAFSATSR